MIPRSLPKILDKTSLSIYRSTHREKTKVRPTTDSTPSVSLLSHLKCTLSPPSRLVADAGLPMIDVPGDEEGSTDDDVTDGVLERREAGESADVGGRGAPFVMSFLSICNGRIRIIQNFRISR